MNIIQNAIRNFRSRYTLKGRLSARRLRESYVAALKDPKLAGHEGHVHHAMACMQYRGDRWVTYLSSKKPDVLCCILVQNHPSLLHDRLAMAAVDLVLKNPTGPSPYDDHVTVVVKSIGRVPQICEEIGLFESLMGNGLYLNGLVDRAMSPST